MTTWRTAACPLNPGSLMAALPRLVRNSQLGVVDRADDFFPEGLALLDHRALLQLLPVIEVDRARLVGLALDEAVVEVDARRPALGRGSRGGGGPGGGGGGGGGPPGAGGPWAGGGGGPSRPWPRGWSRGGSFVDGATW